MTYSTKKIDTNWNKAKNEALKILEDHNIDRFPIDFDDLSKKFNNLKIKTYRQLAKNQECSVSEIIELFGSKDGFISYSAKKHKYIIYYNEDVELKERIYWTIAHEFGHYILKHCEISERANIARNGLYEDEYLSYENEADFFARFLITPPHVITEIEEPDVYKIANIFKVSYKAASSTLNYIKKSYANGYYFNLKEKLKKRLNSFLLKINKGLTCTKCNTRFYFDEAQYCPLCGTVASHHFLTGDDIDMHYPGYHLDEDSKATTCPRCGNSQHLTRDEGEYCPQCGLHLVNRCTRKDEDYNGNEYYDCSASLPGNFRHCPQCGNPSTFYENGILLPWQEVREEEKLPF